MRLIDADVLRASVLEWENCYNGFSDTYDKARIIDAIDEQPTISPVLRDKENGITYAPVRCGKWVKDDIDKYKCSLCGKGNNYAYSWSIGKGDELQDLYCPNCGAKMED